VSVGFTGHEFEKCISVSSGTDVHSFLPRATVSVYLTAKDPDGAPVKMRASFGGYGQFTDRFSDPKECFSGIDSAFDELMLKREGVFCEAGVHTCILDPNISGLFAHEAVGHTIEADGILMGGALGSRLETRVGTEKVTIMDCANTFRGQLCPIPVWVDDEGTKASDVVAIEKGILKGFLHSRDTANRLGAVPTGNARAAFYYDEPLVRMRNTVIVPGEDSIADMIASVDSGYYFTDTEYGQSDSAGEFCFSVNMGYEIKNGKIGRAIRDTTISGIVFDILNSVSMVSDDFLWWTRGSCGKKQVTQTGMGGPSIKCDVKVGGR